MGAWNWTGLVLLLVALRVPLPVSWALGLAALGGVVLSWGLLLLREEGRRARKTELDWDKESERARDARWARLCREASERGEDAP